ncbi:MAG: sucrase ferredoxin [bacterium]
MTALLPEQRCAASSLRRGDDPVATAAPVSRWLLVEQPGRWGRDALTESMIDPVIGRRLSAAAATVGVRIVLIRRPGRSAAGTVKAWAHADSRPGHESLRWGSYSEHADLLDGPLQGIGGQAQSRPVYLVCAHGRHDACCAIRGRPVAAALQRLRPDQVWECSHIGGDRFAANVVVLPEGLYYGHVDVAGAPRIVAAHEAGEVVPALLRGRCSLPAPVQAAQQHARALSGELRIQALRPLAVRRIEAATWRVVLAGVGAPVTVTVRAEMTAAQLLTCAAVRPEPARVFRLIAWEPQL